MSISKYIVVIVLAIMATATMAYGMCGPRDAAPAPADTLSHIGISAAMQMQRATHDQCVQSCLKSFPDRYSAQYKACVRGCPR